MCCRALSALNGLLVAVPRAGALGFPESAASPLQTAETAKSDKLLSGRDSFVLEDAEIIGTINRTYVIYSERIDSGPFGC
jgi:hypothetical protein